MRSMGEQCPILVVTQKCVFRYLAIWPRRTPEWLRAQFANSAISGSIQLGQVAKDAMAACYPAFPSLLAQAGVKETALLWGSFLQRDVMKD